MKKELPSWLNDRNECNSYLQKICPNSIGIINNELSRLKLNDLEERTKLAQSLPYKPDFRDLAYLSYMILVGKRRTVLELGTGFSTLIVAESMHRVFSEKDKIFLKDIRVRDPYSISTVDDEAKYIRISKNRIPLNYRKHVRFHKSSAKIRLFNSRILKQDLKH